ncbi:MAG TPA: hypothetical protein VN611_06480 [Patescibacteria group bacterium]|nr:hypothetical protein [Patescibacteria group bacterium]
MMERLVAIVPDEEIDVRHLPKIFSDVDAKKLMWAEKDLTPEKVADTGILDMAISQLEEKIIVETFRKYGSSRKVAQNLNISQSRAHRLIEKYCSLHERISPNESGPAKLMKHK